MSSLGGGTGTSIGKGSNVGNGARSGTMGGIGGMNNGYGAGGLGSGTLGNTGLGHRCFWQQQRLDRNRTSSFGTGYPTSSKRPASQGEFQVLGETKIIADQRTNSLLVFAEQAGHGR